MILLMAHARVKPALGALYESNERAVAKLYAKAKAPVRYVGAHAQSGPTETVFFDLFDSFADVERTGQALAQRTDIQAQSVPLEAKKATYLSAETAVIARYNSGLSYHAQDDLGRMRSVEVVAFHVRTGHERDWEEIGRLYHGAAARANVDTHCLVYDAVAGAPSGTHFVMRVYRSLGIVDSGVALAEAFGGALGPEGARRVEELSAAAIEESRTDIYGFDPLISYLSPRRLGQRRSRFLVPAGASALEGDRRVLSRRRRVMTASPSKVGSNGTSWQGRGVHAGAGRGDFGFVGSQVSYFMRSERSEPEPGRGLPREERAR